MKSNSNIKPVVFFPLGDGSYHYNYNIVEHIAEQGEGFYDDSTTYYEYETVHIWGEPEYEKIVIAVLRDRLDENEEFSIINKYNAYKIGIIDNKEYEDRYKKYLDDVIKIKDMVKMDIYLRR